MADDGSTLHEKPLEFLTSIADSGGDCGGQVVRPEDGHFRAWCTCGNWSVEVDDAEEGLRLARIHTSQAPH
ncbi:hypothetical protein BMW24_005570 [Mycobacterium heckeshornense]|uniref:Uncharacterized protein n=1 Tax=Mycobacterium heckeshornense TaxID=110505 RepID=A0A2G8BEV9_9MYCO|nr:hypothetical protein [Mycobacterium heckeshornense]KMV24159.1 hypothetical protein ACT16_02025 [Mycobacterium heckeshornense]MCV7036378.1 hypothetical protein [Mycobacterium heckeshornense]PIJ36186.1 hypothetical protein BMW24_005570 [Mycobacterium heckeshornense]BCO34236.1 hypothetical protein MHEC_06690 [Mycobacterium heckeshornense]